MHVFSLFPGLFFLSPFAALLLRLSAAYAFLYIANCLIRDRHEIGRLRGIPVIQRMPEWLVWISALLNIVIAALLAIGLFTQLAAIFGALVAIKHAVLSSRHEHVIPLSSGANALLLVICTALILTGAGAYAVDLPL